MVMKVFRKALLSLLCGTVLVSCTVPAQQEPKADECKNAVIETIMTRRSVRKYQPQAVNRDTMQIILECGINAPNAINKQAWEVRVVDNPEFINGITEVFKKVSPKMAEAPDFKNMFRNAPTVVFIANDTTFPFSQVDCGLMAENMMLSAWSLGVGSICLGSPVRFLTDNDVCKPYIERLGFSEGYELSLCVGFGYADEAPEAKPRDMGKVKYIN